jgi:signal transduction histidine kinase
MMTVAQPQIARRTWLRLPRRTARLRLTALYGGLLLLSGVALVAITYGLFERATKYKSPHLPKIPHALNIKQLQLLPQPNNATILLNPKGLTKASQGLSQIKQELGSGPSGVGPFPTRLAQVQTQLTQIQHQLAQGQHQLADAVHSLAQVAPAQAAQRASDSHQLLVNSGIALAIVAVLALLAGWLLAGRMLRPIRTITRTARRISSTSLHERLALDGPEDELKELGDTLDDLFGRLEAAFEAQRHFVANASHELRTPLTVERTLLQVALDNPDTTIAAWRSTANEVLASSDEQASLIEALLALASSESGLSGLELIDLGAIVTAGLVNLQPEIDRLQIHIVDATTPAILSGDLVLVERLVANLLANAVRHNVVDGRIEVATGMQEGRAVLSVTNTGPLIPPAEVGRLFEPFQRLDSRRAHYNDGHGLGLSIVRAIATAHRATIAADPVPEGGISVSVIFPQIPSPQRVATSTQGDRDRTDVEIATP